MTPEECERIEAIRREADRASDLIDGGVAVDEVSWLLDLVERQEGELDRALREIGVWLALMPDDIQAQGRALMGEANHA